MTRHAADAQAHTLGSFLRNLRERQSPSAHGIAPHSRRRTAGLRREEVAQICGLSSTWYTWIEQGRDVSVSSSTLARLARGLRLSRAERAYLFELAGKHDPDKQRESVEDIPAAVLACVDEIAGPAYILDRMWTARHWNAGGAPLFRLAWRRRRAQPPALHLPKPGGAPADLRLGGTRSSRNRGVQGCHNRSHG